MAIYKRLRKGYRGVLLIESRFYACHPLVSMLYFIGLFSFVFLFTHPIFVLTEFLFTVAFCFFYTELKRVKAAVKASLMVGLCMMLINPIVNHRGATILFYLFDNPITLEAMLYGAFNALTLCNLLLLFLPFNTLIDSERFLYVFGRISPKIAFITHMSLRYISILQKRAKDMTEIQKSRGIGLSGGNAKEKVQNSGRLLGALVASSLEDGMIVSEVLKAKEYGNRKRTHFAFFKFTRKDGLLLAFMTAILIAAFILSAFGAGDFTFYPRLSRLDLEGLAFWAYGLMLAFILALPIVECT